MPIHSWIRRHPDFQVLVLHQSEYFEDWEFLEQFWIAHLKKTGFKLLNATQGGDGNKNQVFSEEAIKKRNAKLRGRPRPEEVRRRISKAQKGKIISSEQRQKISSTLKARGYREPLEVRLKKSKSVYQYSKSGQFVQEFYSINEASRCTGAHKGAISGCACGHQKTAGGYIWRFDKI